MDPAATYPDNQTGLCSPMLQEWFPRKIKETRFHLAFDSKETNQLSTVIFMRITKIIQLKEAHNSFPALPSLYFDGSVLQIFISCC